MSLFIIWYMSGLILSVLSVRLSFGYFSMNLFGFSLLFAFFGPIVLPILLIDSGKKFMRLLKGNDNEALYSRKN